MKKLYLLILLLSLYSFGQSDTRSFSITPSSIQYSGGYSAPIIQTADNGYILNYSYSYPNWDGAPPPESTIVKTDQSFVPLWSKVLPGGNGKKTLLLNDGTSVYFCKSGAGFVYLRIDANGQTLASKAYYATYPVVIQIEDAELFGSTIRMVGSKDTYGGFGGFQYTSQSIIIDFDLNGNVLQTYTLNDSTATSQRLTNISKETSGNYYLTGADNNGNFICKINTDNTIAWCKGFPYSGNSVGFNEMMILSNGNLLLSGYYAGGGYNPFLMRLSANGDVLSCKIINTANFTAINRTAELPDGAVIATGWTRVDGEPNRIFSLKINADNSLAWAKSYNYGFGISAPLIKSSNEWYYTGFHYNGINNNNPILFKTDNTGATNCDYTDVNFTFTDFTLLLNPRTITLSTDTALEIPTDYTPFAPTGQSYEDSCLSLSVTENIRKPKTTLYPNPSAGTVYLKSDTLIESVAIYNTLGQKISEHSIKGLEGSVFIKSNGVYLLMITYETGIEATKVIISN